MVRNERFSEDFQLAVKSLVELVSANIIQKYKEMPVETRAANKALAHFLKVCEIFYAFEIYHNITLSLFDIRNKLRFYYRLGKVM